MYEDLVFIDINFDSYLSDETMVSLDGFKYVELYKGTKKVDIDKMNTGHYEEIKTYIKMIMYFYAEYNNQFKNALKILITRPEYFAVNQIEKIKEFVYIIRSTLRYYNKKAQEYSSLLILALFTTEESYLMISRITIYQTHWIYYPDYYKRGSNIQELLKDKHFFNMMKKNSVFQFQNISFGIDLYKSTLPFFYKERLIYYSRMNFFKRNMRSIMRKKRIGIIDVNLSISSIVDVLCLDKMYDFTKFQFLVWQAYEKEVKGIFPYHREKFLCKHKYDAFKEQVKAEYRFCYQKTKTKVFDVIIYFVKDYKNILSEQEEQYEKRMDSEWEKIDE